MAPRRVELIKAAQYVRMSTEHQKYSIGNQEASIAAYATERGYAIVRTYSDAGISGLRLAGRDGLKRLLADVLGGSADFSVILTFDVSRWGRFQDPDQSAHYEFLCRDAGVHVEYCAEQFENDGSLGASLVKHLKRAMAAEFSRDLSAKVSAGKRRVAVDGYWVGGPAAYGLRRRIVHPDGRLGPMLQAGEAKAVQSARTVLVPGPSHEIAQVRRIFRLFVIGGMCRAEICRTLNSDADPAGDDPEWSPHRIHQVLTNETYAGTQVFGRITNRLATRRVVQPASERVRAPAGFTPFVSRELFEAAQRNIEGRYLRLDDDELLRRLASVFRAEGRLSSSIIKDASGVPCPHIYRRRFGSLIEAYRQVGYDPSNRQRRLGPGRKSPRRRRPAPQAGRSDAAMLDDLVRILLRNGCLSVRMIDQEHGLEAARTYCKRFGGLRRLYALVGYTPTAHQQRGMDRPGAQSISVEAAAVLAGRVRARDQSGRTGGEGGG